MYRNSPRSRSSSDLTDASVFIAPAQTSSTDRFEINAANRSPRPSGASRSRQWSAVSGTAIVTGCVFDSAAALFPGTESSVMNRRTPAARSAAPPPWLNMLRARSAIADPRSSGRRPSMSNVAVPPVTGRSKKPGTGVRSSAAVRITSATKEKSSQGHTYTSNPSRFSPVKPLNVTYPPLKAKNPTMNPLDILRQDLRLAVRSLLRAPGVRGRHDPHAGARNWRQYRDLLDRQRRDPAPARLSAARAADVPDDAVSGSLASISSGSRRRSISSFAR